MIKFTNVTRTYGQKVAVDGLSLTVAAGELLALLGPNGAGKTTTIKMLVGLLRPNSGTVSVGGCDVAARTRDATSMIGYVPEEPYLYDKLSGREFLEFAGEARGLPPATLAERIARESERLDLGAFLDDLIETYSHGMKQRVVFASALLHDPPVLVVDEPMVGLDPRTVRVVKDHLRALAADGRAILMSTHTLSVAEEIAGRIGIVNGGRLHFLGTLAQLQRELSSPHAALEPLFLELLENNHRGAAQPAPPGPDLPA
jgi:ABC-2 type transport system ATP-binding protein